MECWKILKSSPKSGQSKRPTRFTSLTARQNDHVGWSRDNFQECENLYIQWFVRNHLTGSQVAFILWELAKNPESQTKLRAELEANVLAKGNIDFTAGELENMPYLNAVIKVIDLTNIEREGAN